jgi:hypothetical protein
VNVFNCVFIVRLVVMEFPNRFLSCHRNADDIAPLAGAGVFVAVELAERRVVAALVGQENAEQKFTAHTSVGQVGERMFAIAGLLELAAARGQCAPLLQKPAPLPREATGRFRNVTGWPRMETPIRRRGSF